MLGTLLLVFALAQSSQANVGQVRVMVRDASGLPLRSTVALSSDANGIHQNLETTDEGLVVARDLPFGPYRIEVTRSGFAPFNSLIEIRSAVPAEYLVTLSLAPVQAQVTVTTGETLIDPQQTGSVHRVSSEVLRRRVTASPGRALADLVNTQPGWLLEANGILHPRGSEYQTQYVIDGLPLTDNRSPAFAPEIDADDVSTMSILTGGYPAEYGRKLGGVIEVVTAGEARHGFHGSIGGAVGSFSTRSGDALGAYSWPRTTVSVAAGFAGTDRYLDPPAEENFNNHGTMSHASLHLEHDVSGADRVGIVVRRGDVAFQVPNEQVQEQAGQRQNRHSNETVGQLSYQHVFTAPLVVDVRGMARDLAADLDSNPASTPIIVTQARGLRDMYVKATASTHIGAHEIKVGGDMTTGTVNEQFAYQITNRRAFDRDTPRAFGFSDRRADQEQALFAQDQIRVGRWTVNAGLRWDHYAVVVNETALSPRLSVAWSAADSGLVLRASYDRAFQTPAIENLLLASSPAVDVLNDTVLRLPVRPSRGDFYETGISKSVFGVARLDGSYFERHFTDFADDDVLLNTGVSFPIAFQSATIRGGEVKFEIPHWKRFSGSASYSLQRGLGYQPITGGLFLGDEAGSLLASTASFPISQDQRHTIRGRASYQATSSAWTAVSVSFGSGLPVEFDGTPTDAVVQYGQRIVDRVDFGAGRVRPSLSIDASVGYVLGRKATSHFSLQVDVRNIADRLNVINFAGLFSGTALGPPRSVAARLRCDF